MDKSEQNPKERKNEQSELASTKKVLMERLEQNNLEQTELSNDERIQMTKNLNSQRVKAKNWLC